MRMLGLLMLLAIFFAAGLNKIQNPASTGAAIKNGNLPKLLAMANVSFKPSTAEYTMLAQAVGGTMIALATFVFLGIMRRFAAFLLALMVVGITVCMHLNIEKPEKTSEADMIAILKNTSIVGGLLIVASMRAAAPEKLKKH